jgi:hypothetical protein
MQFVVFHSRNGAAALAAALRYVGRLEREEFLELCRQMGRQRTFLFLGKIEQRLVLAVACGQEQQVLQQALADLAKQFSPKTSVEFRNCFGEPSHLKLRLWLSERRLVPRILERRWDNQLWSAANRQEASES